MPLPWPCLGVADGLLWGYVLRGNSEAGCSTRDSNGLALLGPNRSERVPGWNTLGLRTRPTSEGKGRMTGKCPSSLSADFRWEGPPLCGLLCMVLVVSAMRTQLSPPAELIF